VYFPDAIGVTVIESERALKADAAGDDFCPSPAWSHEMTKANQIKALGRRDFQINMLPHLLFALRWNILT
jgi:hypothetical protein